MFSSTFHKTDRQTELKFKDLRKIMSNVSLQRRYGQLFEVEKNISFYNLVKLNNNFKAPVSVHKNKGLDSNTRITIMFLQEVIHQCASIIYCNENYYNEKVSKT